jgi:hypothetical protein
LEQDPSIAEVMRMLVEIKRTQERHASDVRELSDKLDARYVRSDLHDRDMARLAEQRSGDKASHAAAVGRLDQADAFRRQILAGASVNMIGLAVALALAVSGAVR